jgi:hypothetical protein
MIMEYKLEEVVVMKPVRTGAMFSVGAVLGPIAVVAAAYFGYKLFNIFREATSQRFSAEEKPVSNISTNAGVVEVRQEYSPIGGQAYGQTGNDYLQTYPASNFGQNFGGRAF